MISLSTVFFFSKSDRIDLKINEWVREMKEKKRRKLEAKLQMTLNMIKGMIAAIFVVLNVYYFHLNSYVFLAILILIVVGISFIFKIMIEKFMWYIE